MKNKLQHSPVQTFYTIFGITFVIALLHYTIFPFKASFSCMVIVLMSYAYAMGVFNKKLQQKIDLKQAIVDIKESKLDTLDTYVLKMISVTIYLFIFFVIIPFLWLGLLLVFSIFIPLAMGEAKLFEFSILSWLGLILFGLFILISYSSAKDELKNGEPPIQKYIVKLTPQNLKIIKKNDTLSIPWNAVKNIHKTRSSNESPHYYICIVYESDSKLDELNIYLSDFRVGSQHIYLEDFFIKYWLKANGRDIVNIK